jgi:hypothetical protein
MKNYRATTFISGLLIGLGTGGLLLGWEAWWYFKLLSACRLGSNNLPFPYFIIFGTVLLITGVTLGVYSQCKLHSFTKKNVETNK